jgi:catechol 2,3-dioxygenase-like lactoylglutathione lyase family enzyme
MSTTSPSEVSSTPPVCTLTSLDHFVLTVHSLPETIKFYTEILGMAHQSFNSPANPTVTRHALLFGACKINLHQAGKEFEPKARTALPGTADLCFLTDQDVGTVLERLREKGVEVLEVEDGKQLVRRVGARSPLRSLYVRDPDGNLIEYVDPVLVILLPMSFFLLSLLVVEKTVTYLFRQKDLQSHHCVIQEITAVVLALLVTGRRKKVVDNETVG